MIHAEIETAVAHVYGQRVEHVVLLHPLTGESLWVGRGTKDKVSHPLMDGVIVVHNHPSGTEEFSRQDIVTMLQHDEHGCIAVGADRWQGIVKTHAHWRCTALAEMWMQDWERGIVPPLPLLVREIGGKIIGGSTADLPEKEEY